MSNCDIIAVQEIYGEDLTSAKYNINELLTRINKDFGVKYEHLIGKTNGRSMRNGFFFKERFKSYFNIKNYNETALSRINNFGPSRKFERGPVKLLSVNKESPFVFKTYHFKSKAFSWRDPTNTKYEPIRMENAETVRRNIHESVRGRKKIVFIAGDRNNYQNTPSADILEGKVVLDDFKYPANCVLLSDSDKYHCVNNFNRKGLFIPLIYKTHKKAIDNGEKGSFVFRGVNYLIDEILIYRESLCESLSNHLIKAGIINTPKYASDHSMLYVDIIDSGVLESGLAIDDSKLLDTAKLCN